MADSQNTSESGHPGRPELDSSRGHATTPTTTPSPRMRLRRRAQATDDCTMDFDIFGGRTLHDMAADIAARTGHDVDSDAVGAGVLAILHDWLPRHVGDDPAANYTAAVEYGCLRAVA